MRNLLVILLFILSLVCHGQDSGYYEEDKAHMVVDEFAEFPNGGLDAFKKFIYLNVTYPEYAKENGIAGRVFVKFVVMETGEIEKESIEILKSPHDSFNSIVTEAIKKSPAWSIPRIDGKAVRQRLVIPIDFEL